MLYVSPFIFNNSTCFISMPVKNGNLSLFHKIPIYGINFYFLKIFKYIYLGVYYLILVNCNEVQYNAQV